MATSSARQALSEILGRESFTGLDAAYLFGSHAESRAHRESDVDVGVLFRREVYPSSSERFEAQLRLVSLIASELHHCRVDVVVLNDAPPHLARRIVTSGIRLFCADPASDHAFVRDVQLRAADLDPFLRRTRQTKLAALAR